MEKIKAPAGQKYANAGEDIFASVLILGVNDTLENWHLVSDEYAAKSSKKRRAKMSWIDAEQ